MNLQENVKDYYGKELSSSEDLKTDACCTIGSLPDYLKPVLANIHPEVSAKYYGCGLIAPLALEGCRVLDLGSGSGQDAYALAQLVGPKGAVVGVDMTPEQLAVAREHQSWHAEKFGYANVEFLEGDIERLEDLNLEAASFDVIVSNCVINLVEDKHAVLKAARHLLKPGGEFYFSDVYADRRLPKELRNDPVAQGECLGGALYWNDFLAIAKQAGFTDPRLETDRPLAINNIDLKKQLEPAKFVSATYRLFNIDDLERSNEYYGQTATYKGGIPHSENNLTLDNNYVLEKDKAVAISGNTYRMLNESRFKEYVELSGDTNTHQGIFDGGNTDTSGGISFDAAATNSRSCC